MTIQFIFSLFILLFISSCKKDSSTVSLPPPAPTITSVKPLNGKQGDMVIITGSNFNLNPSLDTVRFNSILAMVQKAKTDTLFVIVPAGNCTGVVTVNGIKAPGPVFTVTPSVLSIKTVNPQSAKTGDTIIITGSNFNLNPSLDTVRFNGIPARVQKTTTDTLFVIVPAGNCTGVVTGHGITAPGPGFIVIQILNFSPELGSQRTEVVIKGIPFDNDLSHDTVYFNGVPTATAYVTDSMLEVYVPKERYDWQNNFKYADGQRATSMNDFVILLRRLGGVKHIFPTFRS